MHLSQEANILERDRICEFFHCLLHVYLSCSRRFLSVLIAEIMLLAPAFDWSGGAGAIGSLSWTIPKRLRQYVYATVALTSIVSSLVSLYRSPIVYPQPFKPGPRIIRAGIWTVHFGMNNEGKDSQRGMAALIK